MFVLRGASGNGGTRHEKPRSQVTEQFINKRGVERRRGELMWLSSSGTAGYELTKNLGSIKEAAENPRTPEAKKAYQWLL